MAKHGSWRGALAGTAQAFVVESEELDDGRNVVLAAQPEADPPGVRERVMRLRATGGDEIASQADTDQQIGDPAEMYMPDFAFADAELHTAEAMRKDFHIAPVPEQLGESGAVIGSAH